MVRRLPLLPFLLSLLFTTTAFAASLHPPAPSTKFTQSLSLKGAASHFAVDVYGLPSADNPATPVVRAAFRHLSNVWVSPVRVLCRITFADLGRSESLASGGGVLFVRFDRSPDRELMPIAAAEAITGRELNAHESGIDRYDVLIKINTRTPWHLDIDSKTPARQYDLFTVLLHEAYHNLLFSGAIAVEGGHRAARPVTEEGDVPPPLPATARLLDGYPARFDLFLANEQGCSVLDYRRDTVLANATGRGPAHLLAQAVTNERLFFHDRSSGLRVPLYAPLEYQSKSSIYHIDTARGGTAGVMNRFIPSGFMQREINQEIRNMQRAFLNPDNRGAKRCKFPLSDPAPANGKLLASDPYSEPKRGVFGAPVWLVVLVCAVTVVASIALFFSCSHFIVKRSQPVVVGEELDTAGWSKWTEKRLSESSSELLIDQGVSIDEIEIDVRDLEIDEDDFRLFEYSPEDRYTNS